MIIQSTTQGGRRPPAERGRECKDPGTAGCRPRAAGDEPGTEVLDDPLAATRTSSALQTPWNVIVFNDPVNLMPYVTLVFQKVFGYSETKATQMMLEVHQRGRCIVWSGEREKAEFYVQQLQAHQLQASMKKA